MQDYVIEREILEESVQRDEHELHRAVEELKDVVKRPFAIIGQIAARPVPWIFSALLIGFWLGSNGRETHRAGSGKDQS